MKSSNLTEPGRQNKCVPSHTAMDLGVNQAFAVGDKD